MTRLLVILVTLLPTVLLAQNAPTDTQSPAYTTTLRPRIPEHTLAMDPVSVNQRLANSGGSLLQATVAPAPINGQAGAFSFYFVPPPEPKVIQKHDLVQIIIREESESKHEGTTDLKKEMALEAKVEEWVSLTLRNLELDGGPIGADAPSIKLNGKRNFKGEGTAERNDSITARIQAEVLDVKPNGTLILQARKTLKTDDDEVRLILSGTCRVEDVTADNTVLSTQLYDMELEKVTKGGVTQSTKRGWLPKLLDFVNPF